MQLKNLKMKNSLLIFVMVFAFFVLTNCQSQISTDQNIQREWMLVEFHDFSKDLMVKNKAKLDLSKTTNSNKNFTANMGCNGIFGQAKLKPKGEISFSQMGSTEMFCAENMNLETEFIKILPTITTYKIEGHHLTLSNKNGDILKFVAADWD